jgi:hypothetical protein
MNLRKMRPSASMVVASIAMVAALAGTAYAAVTITDSSQIKGRVVGGKDLQKGSVGGQVVREKSLRGVNADTVDGQTADQLKTRWLLIDERGQIAEQSGGFSIIDAYQTNQNVYIDSGESLADNGLTATISLQNLVDVDQADSDPEPNFSGEVSVARCQLPGAVECAPPGAKNVNAFVVSPRNSDGSPTAAGARKRVYVSISE